MADVGIVLPVYQQKRRLLRAAIKSILNQTYEHFRLYIVFDGSSPELRRAARSAVNGDRRVSYIVCGHNHGIASALNRGFHRLLKKKSIRYLTWVSSDNVYYSHYIEVLRGALRHNGSRVGMAYSSFRRVGDRGQPLFDQAHQRLFRNVAATASDHLLEDCLVGTSFMYKRRFAERVGRYCRRMQPVDDYDYWLRLAEVCKLTYVPRELMDYRMNSELSVSRQLNSSEGQRRWRYAFNLVKCEARRRRGIPLETTVVFPVDNAQGSTLHSYEALLEPRIYSNYQVMLVDLSSRGEVAKTITDRVPDPRAVAIHLPGASAQQAVDYALAHSHSPMFIRYIPGRLEATHLQVLTAQLRQQPSHITAVTFSNHEVHFTSHPVDAASGALVRR